MDPRWKNETTSPKPNQHPFMCWAEEVFHSSKKCLGWCVLARSLLAVASLVPVLHLDGWRIGAEYGENWNIWGPATAPSSLFASVSFSLYLLSYWGADIMPVFGEPFHEKTYHTFADFWPKYEREHKNPVDRVLHVFEFFGVAVYMTLNVRRLTAFSLTLGIGTLLTRPLLHISRARIENDLMYVIGASLATFYGVPLSYALGYAVWLAFDFTGHAYIGENGKAAAFLGKHYLGWALVGQSWFACNVATNFPVELSEAVRCWKSQIS